VETVPSMGRIVMPPVCLKINLSG